jgi:YD repeat-containing protein
MTPNCACRTALDAASSLRSADRGRLNMKRFANGVELEQIAFEQHGTTRMTTSRQYDALNRLTSITNEPVGSSAIGYRYIYNTANQRIRRTESDAAYWLYTYDQLGQVISGKKYWGDGTPVAGQQFEYAFDDIGNRRTNGFGGNEGGLGLRESRYAVNALNGRVKIAGRLREETLVTVE